MRPGRRLVGFVLEHHHSPEPEWGRTPCSGKRTARPLTSATWEARVNVAASINDLGEVVGGGAIVHTTATFTPSCGPGIQVCRTSAFFPGPS